MNLFRSAREPGFGPGKKVLETFVIPFHHSRMKCSIPKIDRKRCLKLNFVVGSRFAAVFTKFTQSKFFFDVYCISSGSIISVFANRTLEYE